MLVRIEKQRGEAGVQRARILPQLSVTGMLLFLAVALLSAPAAQAELRRLEAVGAVGVRQGERSDPRERAVQAALREAVGQVASELLMDAPIDEGGEGESSDERLAELLGDDMGAFASRFRIVEDRGIGPALFVEDPKVTREYVVVAEVQVDTTRVRQHLVERGALQAARSNNGAAPLRLEVRGLREHMAYRELRKLLKGVTDGQSGVPLRFEADRAVLAVKTHLNGTELVARLTRVAPAHMQIVDLGGSARSSRIAVHWTAPPEVEDGSSGPAEVLPAVQTGPQRRRPRRFMKPAEAGGR